MPTDVELQFAVADTELRPTGAESISFKMYRSAKHTFTFNIFNVVWESDLRINVCIRVAERYLFVFQQFKKNKNRFEQQLTPDKCCSH